MHEASSKVDAINRYLHNNSKRCNGYCSGLGLFDSAKCKRAHGHSGECFSGAIEAREADEEAAKQAALEVIPMLLTMIETLSYIVGSAGQGK